MNDLDLHLIHTYNRSITFVKGEDVYLYDNTGKKYLDMGAGIAVSALGYSNDEFKQGLKDQIDQLIHVSNLYYTEPVVRASGLLAAGSGMDKVVKVNIFLTNMADFARVNEVYAQFFKLPFPARSCVAVTALPLGAGLEIEAVAMK